MRSVAQASTAAQQLADASVTDSTVALAQVGALIAHEVNNLLSPALARCDLLRHEVDGNGGAGTLVQQIQASIAQASAISTVVLELAGADSCGSTTRLEPCLRHVLDTLLSPSVRARVHIGSVDSSLVVNISSSALSHVILNVVLNALEATRSARGLVCIELGTCSTRNTSDDRVALIIRDNGVGADASLLRQYYRTFFWGQDRFVGKNLGTLLCRLLVDRAGGEIAVESAPGQGTAVTIFLNKAA